MRILVVGAGGREHALAWHLARDPRNEIHAAPGNPGIAEEATCHAVAVDDIAGLTALARSLAVDLVVVGPEAPLVAGLVDALAERGIATFGPAAAAARIEGSKTFAKEVMAEARVPMAATLSEPIAPCVIKADGLAAGKGVFVCYDQAEADTGFAQAKALGANVVIEELLVGEEVSVFALCDGDHAIGLPTAQDYKRIGDGDTGPNTGGMGSFSPAAIVQDDEVEDILDLAHRPVLTALARRGTPFRGLLYAGLMLTAAGPRVLEFNCRFGDPETQSLLARVDGDLGAALAASAAGDVRDAAISSRLDTAVTVVLASPGYPNDPQLGGRIDGIDHARAAGALVFHAGTRLEGASLVASGGRVLNVTATGDSLESARERAYRAAAAIELPGAQYRRDIGLAAVSGAHRAH